MSDVKQTPPWMFNLEGTFLGFLGNTPAKAKSIVLEVAQEQIVIKVPKRLRASVMGNSLTPGDRLRCIGRSQIDFKSRVIKLKAYSLFPLPPHKEDAPLPISPIAPNGSYVASSRLHVSGSGCLPVSSKQKRAKILVCHKSGCQKRGGRQLVAKLEQFLREHQLNDQVQIQYTGCQKRCSKAPNFTIMPGKHHYDGVSLKSLPTLVEKHFCTSK